MDNLPAMGLMIFLNPALNVGATTGFALSGNSNTVPRFVFWQLIGSVFGFGTQIWLAGPVHFSSLEFANAIVIGLAFVSALIFSAHAVLSHSIYRLAVARHRARIHRHHAHRTWKMNVRCACSSSTSDSISETGERHVRVVH